MSDEYDIANDAGEEAFYDEMYAEFKREHAAEIADDITTGEVVGAALAAHKEWWPLAEGSLIKARDRLAQTEWAEALFHAGRAFDGYVQNVLVSPLRVAFVERLERFMPPAFPLKEGNLFKSVRGLGNAAAFAEYTISVIAKTNDDAEAIIRDFRSLLGHRKGVPPWQDRDRAFHAPIEVTKVTARTLLERAEAILTAVVTDMTRLLAAEEESRTRLEFSSARVQTLHALATMFDADRNASLEDYRIPSRSDAIEDRGAALGALLGLGYVEGIDDREAAFPFPRIKYRLTEQGRRYYEAAIVPRLPAHLTIQ
ncbi:MAG: hypothetical protein WA304_11055 [Candidatus Cybelea sp.]